MCLISGHAHGHSNLAKIFKVSMIAQRDDGAQLQPDNNKVEQIIIS
jgi:hypothetical protein